MNRSACFCSDEAEPIVYQRPPTILTIDDDPNVCQALRRRLGQYRATVVQAGHGAHGLWLATTQRPDVIITDLRPGHDEGRAMIEFLRSTLATREIPLVVLAAEYDAETENWLDALGVTHFFTKPIDFAAVCETLRQYVALQPWPSEQHA
jgi:response regulator RpfG family c-di-GMP phosphodiesterase